MESTAVLPSKCLSFRSEAVVPLLKMDFFRVSNSGAYTYLVIDDIKFVSVCVCVCVCVHSIYYQKSELQKPCLFFLKNTAFKQ